MPRSSDGKAAVFFLRKEIKKGCDIAYGSSNAIIEAGVSRGANALLASLAPEERAQCAQGVLPDSVGWEELTQAFSEPHTLQPYKPPPKEISGKSTLAARAHDKWHSAHKTEINRRVAVLEAAGAAPLLSGARTKLRKRVAWEMWSALSMEEKRPWALEVDQTAVGTPKKKSGPYGPGASPDDKPGRPRRFGAVCRIREAKISDTKSPTPNWLYVLFDFEELLTLPLAPVETSGMFYARNRLGVTTLGAKVWGAGQPPKGLWFCYLSRVIERTGAFSVAILRDLLGGWRCSYKLLTEESMCHGKLALSLKRKFRQLGALRHAAESTARRIPEGQAFVKARALADQKNVVQRRANI